MRIARTRRRRDLWPSYWRRHPLALAVLVLAIIAASYFRVQRPSGNDYDRYHNQMFTCVKTVDGDTIDIDIPDGKHNTTRIRLWGVDTPETDKSPTGTMYFGPQASAYTKSLVDGKAVRVVLAPQRTRDKYERLLAYVYLGSSETMLNEELITHGYAYADYRFDHPWKERFGQLETKARKEKAGLWAQLKFEQMPSWRQRYEKKTASVPQ